MCSNIDRGINAAVWGAERADCTKSS